MTESGGGSVLHRFKQPEEESLISPILMIAFLIAILLGIFSGYFLAQMKRPLPKTAAVRTTSDGKMELKTGQIIGATDTKAFTDNAQGQMAEGGIANEGQYHLIRPGGDSQNVYLTSSTVDLSQFIGHKVKVWGATQKAQTAGWLMDVGRVEVIQ